jgi:L-aspartate oxidase
MSSQSGERKQFDVLVIGSGLAGLYYCLKSAELNPDIRIALLSKTHLKECNSHYAQGGIAAAQENADDLEQHIADTIRASDDLAHRAHTRKILEQGQSVIRQLEQYRVAFDKQDGVYQLAQEGGHSQRRIYHCGDITGQAMINALSAAVIEHPQILCFEYHTAVNLIKSPSEHKLNDAGEIIGAYALAEKEQKIHTFFAKCTVIASGGAGKVFRYTTNPEVATGDGIAMAFRAGARVGNMEFFQFHPTLLFHPTVNNFLISEAVRGEGAILRNHKGEAFMAKYAPEQKDLATRDIVARAIFTEIEQANSNHVYLDITHQSREFLQQHFPQIFDTLLQINIDMSKDLIPVVPAAHYLCGGVLTDPDGKTDLNRLMVIGEAAFTGLHGANRLASNSLLEACAMAENASHASQAYFNQPMPNTEKVKDWYSGDEINPRRASQINAHWRGLRGEMMSYAGIVRTDAGLQDLLVLIKTRKRMIEEYYWQHQITRDLIELRNIIRLAELIVQSAINRRESRGGHFREDFPEPDPIAKESIVSPMLFS